jgi:hypothetical protein
MSDTWLKPFDEVFLGLDGEGLIQRVTGSTESILSGTAAPITGLVWPDFISRYAAESVRTGLRQAWIALAQQAISAAHFPAYLPFKPGIVVRLRPLTGDPELKFAAHLSANAVCRLDTLAEQVMLEAIERITRLSKHVFSGVDGPLTDKQVQEMRGVVEYADTLRQLLHDLRAEVLSPAVTVPQPLSVTALFNFSEHDFTQRRVTTHQLAVRCRWTDANVYCYPTLRTAVYQLIDRLLFSIAPRSAIELSDQVFSQDRTVRVAIHYVSPDAALHPDQRLDPLELADVQRLEPLKPIQGLITMLAAGLKPVNGQAWAEPAAAENSARVVLVLPHWQGPIL